MNKVHVLLLSLLLLATCVTANAQGSGIHTDAVGGNPGVGVQVPVPQSAQLKAGGNLNGMTMEWMGLSMKFDQFLKLAQAAKLELRIGAISMPLTDRHVEIIHNFANQITVR